MANQVYTKAKQSLLNGEINTSLFNYKLLFVNTDLYTVNINTDQYVSDIPTNAIKTVSDNLANVTNANGILNADDIIVYHDGSSFNAIVLYQVGSSSSTSRLVLYIDDSSSLPFDGSSSPIVITIFWSDTINKILSL